MSSILERMSFPDDIRCVERFGCCAVAIWYFLHTTMIRAQPQTSVEGSIRDGVSSMDERVYWASTMSRGYDLLRRSDLTTSDCHFFSSLL